MAKWGFKTCASLVLAILAQNCAAWADPQSVTTTLCRVIDASKPYKSRVVTITAYVSATADGIYLRDDACPDGIIVVVLSPPYSDESKVDDWEYEFDPRRPPRKDTSGKFLYCICTGTMGYTSTPMAGVPALIISKVEKFWYGDKNQTTPPVNSQ